mgnify:CR=1 FL=1
MKKCWLKTAALAAGCLAFLLGGFSGCKGEIEDFDDDGDASTRVAIDISTNADTKDWTEVAAYVYGGSIGDDGFGTWPGLVLKQSESNPAVFYSDDLSGKKLGNGTIIFNNNNNGSQTKDIEFTIEEKQKLIYRAGKFDRTSAADLGISSAGNDSKDGETDSQSGSGDSGNGSQELPDMPSSIYKSQTVIGIDIAATKKDCGTDDWNGSEMQLYAWGGNAGGDVIFGGWGGKKLVQAADSSVYYYVFDAGDTIPNSEAYLCFHDDKGENSDRVVKQITITAGEKKILRGTEWADWGEGAADPAPSDAPSGNSGFLPISLENNNIIIGWENGAGSTTGENAKDYSNLNGEVYIHTWYRNTSDTTDKNLVTGWGDEATGKMAKIGSSDIYYLVVDASAVESADTEIGFQIVANKSEPIYQGSIHKGEAKIYHNVNESPVLEDWDISPSQISIPDFSLSLAVYNASGYTVIAMDKNACDKNPGEGKTYSVHIYDETQTPTKNHTDWPGKTLKGLQVGTDYYYYAIPNTLFSGDGKPLTIIFTNGDTANIWQARSQSVYKNKNIFLNKDGMFAHWN